MFSNFSRSVRKGGRGGGGGGGGEGWKGECVERDITSSIPLDVTQISTSVETLLIVPENHQQKTIKYMLLFRIASVKQSELVSQYIISWIRQKYEFLLARAIYTLHTLTSQDDTTFLWIVTNEYTILLRVVRRIFPQTPFYWISLNMPVIQDYK